MKTLVLLITAPVWLPLLLSAGCASAALGACLVVAMYPLRRTDPRDEWDELAG